MREMFANKTSPQNNIRTIITGATTTFPNREGWQVAQLQLKLDPHYIHYTDKSMKTEREKAERDRGKKYCAKVIKLKNIELTVIIVINQICCDPTQCPAVSVRPTPIPHIPHLRRETCADSSTC